MFLVLNLMLGAVMSHTSIAQSVVIPMVDHPGVSQEQLERVYTEAYQQSGFRLIDRRQENGYGSNRVIKLTFELTGASHADNVPGTTLAISSGGQATPCTPCQLSRESYMAPDASNPDDAVRARGKQALANADAAALAKVRQHIGISLPEVFPPAHPAH
jgi:hypothetical protein